MKKNITIYLVTFLSPFLIISCKGSGSATAADSTTLYTGPPIKNKATTKEDSNKKADSLYIGPDSFRADSARRAAAKRK